MEEKKTKSKATIRKASKRGQRTQRMVSFRLDNELEDFLADFPNKGRLINQLLYNEKIKREMANDGL